MASPQPFSDRRASVRTAAAVPLVYGRDDSWTEGTVVDISAGGVGVTGPKIFPANCEVELRFGTVPRGGHLVSIRAIVRHSQGARMGMEFVNLGAGDHRKILDTVQHLTAQLPAAGKK